MILPIKLFLELKFPLDLKILLKWEMGSSVSKSSACNAGDPGLIPGSGRSPGKGNGNHSSDLAWRIPWTEEPGGLQSMVLQQSDMT